MAGIGPPSVQNLLAGIAALNATLDARGPAPAASGAVPGAPAGGLGIDQFVRSAQAARVASFYPGMSGPAVAEIQRRLVMLGYLSGAPDGCYANGTVDAVRYFQQEYGRPVTGVLDADDQAVMVAVLMGQRPRLRRAPEAPVPPAPAPQLPASQAPAPQTPAPQAPASTSEAPVSASSDGGVVSARWDRTWTASDVDWLARAIAAEARGEISKYRETGDRKYRDEVLGAAYVIARTAADRHCSIEELIKNQPMFLSAWGMGPGGRNADNYRQFTAPTSEVSHYAEMVEIAKEALAGRDPTGINPNHYFDDSIEDNPPNWARGNVERQKIASLIFVDNTGVA